MIPAPVLSKISDEMLISKGETKTITGAFEDGSFVMKIARDRKGFFSFVYGVLITSGGAFDLVEMIEKDMLINNVLHT